MTKTPASDVADYIYRDSTYFPIRLASKLLECSADDLLHLGAIGKVEILAPVIAEGIYELTLRFLGSEPTTTEHSFNSAERVILSWEDLAIIEGQGWTIPKLFYSSITVQEFDELVQSCLPESFDGKFAREIIEAWKKENRQISSLADSPMQIIRRYVEKELRKSLNISAWHAKAQDNSERTTISHLFISKIELERLKSGAPQGPDSLARQNNCFSEEELENSYKSNESFSSFREEVLVAAICCNEASQAKYVDASEWAEKIFSEAEHIWPNAKVAPLGHEGIQRLLAAALDGKLLHSQ
jgi:hypothetical protein